MTAKRRRKASQNLSDPALPTYATAAEVLERRNGSGLRLAGWTIARTALIFPPLLVVGIDWKRAAAGALVASSLISAFTLLRIAEAGRVLQAAKTHRSSRSR